MYAKPIIERFGIDIPRDTLREYYTHDICTYLEGGNTDNKDAYYRAIKSLLDDEEHIRILLYLPFNDLADAPDWFKQAYRNAWYKLLSYYDVRENFHTGDVFEDDARPGELDRVIKCIHLLPWLLNAHYISYDEIINIVENNTDDDILLYSIKDTLNIIKHNNLLNSEELLKLYRYTSALPDRTKMEPLYISPARLKWLAECSNDDAELVNGNNLYGPFSNNIIDLVPTIEAQLNPNDIVLVSGSRLKGYGTRLSDIDTLNLEEIASNPILKPGNPCATHIYFNSLWVAGSNIKNLDKLSKSVVSAYNNTEDRKLAIERLECDLLQYRLLHKGFSRVTGRKVFKTSKYSELDGDCPFYDNEYRKLATILYAKYVYIPSII